MNKRELDDAIKSCRLHARLLRLGVKAEVPALPRNRRIRRELERLAEYDEAVGLTLRRIRREEQLNPPGKIFRRSPQPALRIW